MLRDRWCPTIVSNHTTSKPFSRWPASPPLVVKSSHCVSYWNPLSANQLLPQPQQSPNMIHGPRSGNCKGFVLLWKIKQVIGVPLRMNMPSFNTHCIDFRGFFVRMRWPCEFLILWTCFWTTTSVNYAGPVKKNASLIVTGLPFWPTPSLSLYTYHWK